MRWSLATSLGIHAAILIAALVVLPNPSPHDVKPMEAIQVDISKIGDVTKKMAMATDAPEKVEKPTSKKAAEIKKADPTAKISKDEKKAAKAAKTPPPEKTPDPPKDESKKAEDTPLDADPLKDLIKDTVTDPEEQAVALKKAEEKKKAEAKKKADEKKKAEDKKTAEDKKKAEAKKLAEDKKKADAKKKQKLDVAKLEDLLNSDAVLNKENDEKTTTSSESSTDGSPTKAEANLQGDDGELVGTIVDGLVSRVKECWTVPPGAREAGITVRIHFVLNQDGSLKGNPSVENYQADPLFDATARSAVAALIECQAYSFLPADRYDLWKDNTLDFDPKQMFQG